MNDEAIVIHLLLQNSAIWVAFMLGFVPALVAGVKQRRKTRWYVYGLVCALVAWPLVTLPTIHALLLRRRNDLPEPMGQRRRADALALLKEASVRSYPSWIAELSSTGLDRRHYACRNLTPGEALELVREPFNASDDHAVAYYHRAIHLGFVPKRHRWIAEALDDGLSLMAVVENVKFNWISRQRASFVGTRIIVLSDRL
jgi:HIRAN domain